jgi:hypothetical protein
MHNNFPDACTTSGITAAPKKKGGSSPVDLHDSRPPAKYARHIFTQLAIPALNEQGSGIRKEK